MANAFDAIGAMLESAGSVSNTVNKYVTDQAKLSTQTKNIQLQEDINGQLARIKQDNKFENWNSEINSFFEQIKSNMSNPDSPYYCRNNLQAEMFNEILSQNQVNVSNHVNNLVIQEQQTKNKIDINNSLLKLQQSGLSGQEYYNAAMELINSGNAVGTYTQAEYEQMNEDAFYTGYSAMYENMFNNTITEAIKRGDSSETIWNMMQETAPKMMKMDASNMPAAFDKEAYDNRLKQIYEKKYKAIQQDIWNDTEKKFADYYDNMLDQRTAEGRNRVASQARSYIDSVKNTGLASPDQITKWTSRFVLEDYLQGGTTTESQAQSALSKMKASDKVDFYIGQWKKGSQGEEGGIDSAYNAYNLLKKDLLKEAQAIVPGATWTDIEEACPAVMDFFEKAKAEMKNIPGMKDIISTAEEMLGVIGNDKENIGMAMDIVNDALLESDVSTMNGTNVEAFKKRVATAFTSLYGNALEKSKYKDYIDKDADISAITKYQEGVIGQEATLAKALKVRDANPDLVYKNNRQQIIEAYGKDVANGLTYIQQAEKNEIAKYIKATEGVDIDTDTIKGEFDEDGAYDSTARQVYTVGDWNYRLRSDDGKSVIIEKKKIGEDAQYWKPVEKTKEIEKANSQAEAKTKKEKTKVIKTKIMETQSMPKAMAQAGKFASDDGSDKWTNTNNVEDREYMLRVTANKISDDAAMVKNTLNGKAKPKKQMQPSEFESKYGIDYYSWIRSSDEEYRTELILNSK